MIKIYLQIKIIIIIIIFKKLVTLEEGDPKASISIAMTPRCRRGHDSIPRIAPLLTLIVLIALQSGIMYNFWVFGMTQPGIETFFESLVWLNLRLNHHLPYHWQILSWLDK